MLSARSGRQSRFAAAPTWSVLGAAPELCRRAESLPQGDDHSDQREQGPVPDRADRDLHGRSHRLGGGAIAAGVVLADVNVGLLYVLAASSLGVYGVIVAGWASNSKYPFFSALRAAAQMVSYEVSIGFVLICVVLYSGSFNLATSSLQQRGFGLGLVNGFGFNLFAVPDGGGVLHQLDGRNIPHPVRPCRGGERARRRPPDRIFVDELRALLARRICQRAS